MLFRNISFFLLLFLTFKSVVGGGVVRIKSVDDFKNFVTNVNSGTNYSGTTVLLDSDLSLSGETLEPIGNYSIYFCGVFDGQGHIISDLKMNSSSSQYTGLFGYSGGLTIRNVVLDSSCSITSSFSDSDSVYLGGIIGLYYSWYGGNCNIENSVNMADVTFSGNISTYYLRLGGIAGELFFFSCYSIYVKNCANYGSVTHSGTSEYSRIGGIVGELSGLHYGYLYNSLNYGTITHSGTTSSELYLGGIAGSSYYAYIENCVSTGGISIQTTPSSSYVGGIVGSVDSSTYINYCYYTSDLSEFSMYGHAYSTPSISYTLSYDNITFELSGTVSVGSYTGTSLVGALNAYSGYYFLRDYSHWLLNKEKKSVKFTINSRTSPITMNSQIILLPSLASEGNIIFDGWYIDSECTHPLELFGITEDKTLYGIFEENTKNYTITFDTKGGSSVAPIKARFGTVVTLPSDVTREHCSVAFWENEYGYNVGFNFTMPARNFTLYAVWKCTHIKTPGDFVDFSKVVNSGTTNYNGTTVLLDSDLSLSGKTLEPIGKDDSNYFCGVFDGQGHIISDLTMSTPYLRYTGLFGYSKGLIIRNIVLDSSCSIASSCGGSNHIYIGGIIGGCSVNSGEHCNIENSVNMADVTFSGNITYYGHLRLGGIAGYLDSFSNYPIYVKNCANYGSITHSGNNGYSYIGGVVGYFDGSSSNYKYIYNCLNYGAITHSGTTSDTLYLGGITGFSYYAYIENCVGAGGISIQTTPSSSSIGSIVGRVYSYTHINYCYYTSEFGNYKTYGTGTPSSSSYTLSYDSTTFGLSGTVSVGSYTGNSLISALNAASDYYNLRDYSKWLLNKEKKSVTFTINSRASPITTDYQIILLPSLASEGCLMFKWYNDDECTNPLESFEITGDKTLYGTFEENTNDYTITFGTRGGSSVAPITAQFGTVVTLPSDLTREHCGIALWETEYGDNVGLSLTMPARNFTLYAVWKCTHITTLDDLVDFSKIVNFGTTNYSGTTVLLDSDLSLSGEETLEPIGRDTSNYFRGVFDGQGHTISDLKVNTSSEYAGLFGYSRGLTIRNVVLDSSCSITSSYSGSDVGGIIGQCNTDDERCNIENSVNMADVSFSGNISGNYLYLGGIAGYLESFSNYPIYVKNCANYGSITHSGNNGYSYIGGVVGYFDGSSSYYGYLYNCLNYGTITRSGTTNYLHLGGIVGCSDYTYIENCVSAGKISTQNTPSYSYIGSIVGRVYSSTYINYCYYTSDVGSYPINGTGTPESTTGTPTSATTVDSSLIANLNNYASDNGWNEWLFNEKNVFVTFIINHGDGFTVNSQVILFPDPVVDDGNNFTGWYKDSSFKKTFSSSSISSDITLYGQLIIKGQKYYPGSDSSDKSANHAGVLSPFMQLVYFLL